MFPGTMRAALLSSGYNPLTQIPNLLMLYDASALSTLFQDDALTTPDTANNQVVGGWVDPKNGRNLLQATNSLRPLYKTASLGSGPCVQPDVTDDVLATGVISLPQPYTIITIGQLQGTGAQYICDGASGARAGILIASGNWNMNGGSVVSTGIAADTNPHCIAATFNGANSTFQLDGAAPVTVSAGIQTATAFRLFLRSDNTQPSGFKAGLFVIVSGTPSNSTINDIRNYGRSKGWGNP